MRTKAFCAAAIGAGLGLAAEATFQPVGSMSQLMTAVIYPASDAIFYVDRQPPRNEVEWNALAGQALVVAESGNLLMLPGRARSEPNWAADSKLLVEAGAAAYKAALARDLDGVRAVNDKLYTACVTCHNEFRPRRGRGR